LLSHHEKLLQPEPRIFTDEVAISNLTGERLLSSQITFRSDHQTIKKDLKRYFFDLFREYGESSSGGFEVVITFNAVLYNKVSICFLFV